MKLRKGVLLINICDQYVLVAGKEARKYCRYITELNDTGAFIWKQIEQCKNVVQIIAEIQKEFDVDDDEEIKKYVFSFIRQLKDNGYLTEADDII